MRFVVVALPALFVFAISASAQQAMAEFDAVSIKRDPTNTFAFGYPPYSQGNQFRMIGMRVRDLITFGYPVETRPTQVIGLPDWAETESYQVIAKGKPNPTLDEIREMWRALFRDRFRLQAHYETRDRAGYHLVLAKSDKRRGPQLQPSTLDCTKPPPPVASAAADGLDARARMLMQRCGIAIAGTDGSLGFYAGSTSLADLASILSSSAGRPIVDRTGLEGKFALALRFASEPAPSSAGQAATTDEAPALFTALQEQLGLKLEAATVQGQVLVIDHIERPSEN